MTSRGLQYDRRWMVVDAGGNFMTQRKFPRMALISVAIANHLTITAPGMPALSVPLVSKSANRIKVSVWGDECEAVAVSPESKAWFTQFIGTDCQLVYMPDNSHRPVDHGKFDDGKPVSFADAYPYLLISEASLSHLNGKLATAVSMNRFRPNLVIRGCQSPHAEDGWQSIRIGSATFSVLKPCARCSIPTVDQATGARGKEPIKTLATYRAWDGAIWFGQNLVQKGLTADLATLQVGHEMEVLA